MTQAISNLFQKLSSVSPRKELFSAITDLQQIGLFCVSSSPLSLTCHPAHLQRLLCKPASLIIPSIQQLAFTIGFVFFDETKPFSLLLIRTQLCPTVYIGFASKTSWD